MRQLAAETGCPLRRPHRTCRREGRNLNHALAQAHGEFIAIFDADHVADPRFLDRTLGYFRRCGLGVRADAARILQRRFVRTPDPQARNLERCVIFSPRRAAQPRCLELDESSPESSAVLRRRALDDIGGFHHGHDQRGRANLVPPPRRRLALALSIRRFSRRTRAARTPRRIAGSACAGPKIRCNCCCAKTSSAIPA